MFVYKIKPATFYKSGGIIINIIINIIIIIYFIIIINYK